MYEYVSDAERLRILNEREQKRDLEIGEGGEGYIAPEDWCYNCGACGHLGFVSLRLSTVFPA
jgi:protein AIR1/2